MADRSLYTLSGVYRFYSAKEICQQPVGKLEDSALTAINQYGIDQIPWGHNIQGIVASSLQHHKKADYTSFHDLKPEVRSFLEKTNKD